MGGTCEAVISAYEHFLEDSEAINQTFALQLIFDLRFVQTLLLLRESKVSVFHTQSSFYALCIYCLSE